MLQDLLQSEASSPPPPTLKGVGMGCYAQIFVVCAMFINTRGKKAVSNDLLLDVRAKCSEGKGGAGGGRGWVGAWGETAHLLLRARNCIYMLMTHPVLDCSFIGVL